MRRGHVPTPAHYRVPMRTAHPCGRSLWQVVLSLSAFGDPVLEFKATRLVPLMAAGAFIVSERMGVEEVPCGVCVGVHSLHSTVQHGRGWVPGVVGRVVGRVGNGPPRCTALPSQPAAGAVGGRQSSTSTQRRAACEPSDEVTFQVSHPLPPLCSKQDMGFFRPGIVEVESPLNSSLQLQPAAM